MSPKQLVKEWFNKAESDFAAAVELSKSRKQKQLYCIIAFHCQQAIEKYLKALLVGCKIDFPKTHDLLLLITLLNEHDQFLSSIKKELILLNPFSIKSRYPGEDIDRSEMNIALKTARNLRTILVKRITEFL